MVPLDTQERLELCALFDELGPSVPTLLEGWTAHDLAAHSCCENAISLPGPPCPARRLSTVPEQRRVRLAERNDFTWLVARIRSGPPVGLFRIEWVRALANLNEFFVHHEDVRRANRRGPRNLTPAMDAALWRNVRRSSHFLSRRLHGCGLEIEWAGTNQWAMAGAGDPRARLSGTPDELRSTYLGAKPRHESKRADRPMPFGGAAYAFRIA